MKKIVFIAVIFFFFALCPFYSEPCRAQSKTSGEYYKELLQNYRQYQGLIEPFNTKKSRHLSLQSVETQAAFLGASRELILSEVNAITSYANFIKAQLAEATQILEYRDSFIYIKLDDEISFLKEAKTKAEKLSSLADSQALMDDISGHFLKIRKMGYQIKSIIETESSRKIFKNLKVEREKLSGYFDGNKGESSQLSAAKEKFSGLDKEIKLGEGLLSQVDNLQKNYETSDPKGLSSQIRETIDKLLKNINDVVVSYKSIIFSLNQ